MVDRTIRLFDLSGILAVTLLWLGVGVGIALAELPLIGSKPLSALGTMPESALLFNTSVSVSALFFSVYFYRLYRRHRLPAQFALVAFINVAAQFLVGIFSYEGREQIIHTSAAFTWAFSIPILMRIFYLHARIRPSILFLRAEYAAVFIGIGLFVFTEGIAPLAEMLPALPYHAWIMTMAVAGRHHHQP